MKKSTKKQNKNIKIVAVWDKISDTLVTTVIGATTQACVANAIWSGIGNKYPYRDLKLVVIGEINRDKPECISYSKTYEVKWDDYKAPATERENLAELGEDVVKAFDKVQEKKEEDENNKSNDSINNDNNMELQKSVDEHNRK